MWNLLAASLLTVASADASISTLSNEQFAGKLLEFSNEGIVIETGEGKQQFSPSQLLRVAVSQTAKPSNFAGEIRVELVDGSRIRSSHYEVANGKVMIGVAGGKTLETQADAVRHVLLRSHRGLPDLQQQWQQVLEETLLGDTVVIRKFIEEGEGLKRTELRPVEGVLFDVTAESVQFKFLGEVRKVGREKIDALIYYHAAGRELPAAFCRIDDIYGSQWQAKSIRLTDSSVDLITSTGVAHSLPLNHIRSFDFTQGKIVYLSDLTPAAVRWRPFYGSSSIAEFSAKLNEPQMDQSFAGTKLAVLDDQQRLEFEKGLAIRSHTSLLYILPDDYKTLVATVGLEPERGNPGDVRFQISGNGKTLYDQTIRGDEPARKIEIPIAGVRRLGIVVDFGGNLTIGDYLHFCDAKVKK